jgi:hypothetical protein
MPKNARDEKECQAIPKDTSEYLRKPGNTNYLF